MGLFLGAEKKNSFQVLEVHAIIAHDHDVNDDKFSALEVALDDVDRSLPECWCQGNTEGESVKTIQWCVLSVSSDSVVSVISSVCMLIGG